MALGELSDLIDGIIKRTVRQGDRGSIIDAINESETALDSHLDEGLTSDDDFAHVRFLIGSLYYNLGQFDEAIFHFKKGLEFNSEYKYRATLYLYLAGAYFNKHDVQQKLEYGIKAYYLGKLTEIPLLRYHPERLLERYTPRIRENHKGEFPLSGEPNLERLISEFVKDELPDEVRKIMKEMNRENGIQIGDQAAGHVKIKGFENPLNVSGYYVDYVVIITSSKGESVELAFDTFGRLSDIIVKRRCGFVYEGEVLMVTSTMSKSQFNNSEFNDILRKALTKLQYNYFCGSLNIGDEGVSTCGFFQRGYLFK